jgi:ribosomal protein L29
MNKKLNEIRNAGKSERIRKLTELMNELAGERAVKSTNTRPESPGKARNLRRQIARIHTITRENEMKQKSEVKN